MQPIFSEIAKIEYFSLCKTQGSPAGGFTFCKIFPAVAVEMREKPPPPRGEGAVQLVKKASQSFAPQGAKDS